jgi:hypothetical protein
MTADLETLAKHLDPATHSVLDVTLDQLRGEFVRYGQEPWVLIEGSWWRLNPDRPDFRPRADAPRLVARGDASELPARDLAGQPRRSADLGALAAAIGGAAR